MKDGESDKQVNWRLSIEKKKKKNRNTAMTTTFMTSEILKLLFDID